MKGTRTYPLALESMPPELRSKLFEAARAAAFAAAKFWDECLAAEKQGNIYISDPLRILPELAVAFGSPGTPEQLTDEAIHISLAALRTRPRRSLMVEQSKQTKIWYVRDVDTGEILVDRETKDGANKAMNRLLAKWGVEQFRNLGDDGDPGDESDYRAAKVEQIQ